jgi:hypothetical protein
MLSTLELLPQKINHRCLEPLANQYGLVEVRIHGSVSDHFVELLSYIMKE